MDIRSLLTKPPKNSQLSRRAMLRAADKISDLIFSPGRPPQVQVYGQLISVQVPGITTLTADDTRHIAADLIGDSKQAVATLREQGSCDISY